MKSHGERSRHRHLAGAIAALAVLALLFSAAPAGAATQIGETFEPTGNCSPRTRLQIASPNNKYAAPFAGVITSWSEQSSSAGGESPVVFKVARAAGGDNYTIVGQSEGKPIPDADQLNTFPVRIPVQAGDVIGLFSGPPSVFLCSGTATGYTVGLGPFGEDTALGATSTFPPVPDQRLAISAVLEADCDSDGLGDETQDPDTKTCPVNNFTFGKLKRNKKRGTAKLTVQVPGPGTLTLTGKGLVKQRPGGDLRTGDQARTVTAAGPAKLKIKPKGKKKSKLVNTGKVKVKAKVTFTPTGGLAKTQTKKIRLVLKP